MDRSTRTLLMVLGICVGAVVAFVALQGLVRSFEAQTATRILRALGSNGVHRAGSTRLLIVPGHRPAFHVLITPSCSSLASVLAFACLLPLSPHAPALRRTLGVTSAAALIVCGNVLRVTGSIAVGLLAGRASLVLFHDWVGSTFTFVYTLVGYVVLLTVLLPRTPRIHGELTYA